MELGAERIVYSEDFPYIVRDDVSTFFQQCGLSEARHHAIANAEALLRIWRCKSNMARSCRAVGLAPASHETRGGQRGKSPRHNRDPTCMGSGIPRVEAVNWRT
jgi:hypothetical protein